ncbi:MAG: type II toxin-antitoxin system RelE/ParE family toxin [Deltaproteobacteria bacterium]|nr:type II toxin-antitoxin system RelE/ParE family toxin [Deltaproteobacteria bacterium]
MVKDVIILKDVVDDLNDGKTFYDKRERGVGDYFWDSLFADMESLILYAGIHNKEHGFYRMLAKRFPYAIYYDVVDDIAHVVAILPMRRNPGWITRKIKDRS